MTLFQHYLIFFVQHTSPSHSGPGCQEYTGAKGQKLSYIRGRRQKAQCGGKKNGEELVRLIETRLCRILWWYI